MNGQQNLVTRLYLRSLPANVLAVLGGTINVLVDGVLVGNKIGEVGLTVINQSLSIYLLLCTLGSLVGSGCFGMSAVAAGKNRMDLSQQYYSSALSWGVILSVVFCAGSLVFIDPICRLLSTEESYDLLKTYLTITLIGGIFKVMLYIPFFYLRLEGKNNQSAAVMSTMMVLNIVLDYVSMYPLDMGIAGAAWASVLATVVACVMGFLLLHSNHSGYRFRFGFCPREDLKGILQFGSPMAFNNVLSSARLLFLNMIFNAYFPVGAALFAVINSLNEFLICVQNGIPQTATAMTGLYMGEKDYRGMRNLLQVQLRTGLLVTIVIGGAVIAANPIIPGLFGSDMTDGFAFSAFAVSFVLGTLNSIYFYYFTSIGKAGIAGMITLLRVLVLEVLFCYLFRGGAQIWLFLPAAEGATLLILLAVKKILSRRKGLDFFLLLDVAGSAGDQSISVEVLCDDNSIVEARDAISGFCEENAFLPKTTMAVSLAVEELLTIINQKSLSGEGTMDLKLVKAEDCLILRIRSGGKHYNPVELADDSLDYLGVRMIKKMSRKIDYQSTLGLNTLIIKI